MKKPRLFFLTNLPPRPSFGSSMLFYRHFVQRQDFDLFVATDDQDYFSNDPAFPGLFISRSKIIERLMRTRAYKFVHDYHNLFSGSYVAPSVLEAARNFQPDAVFSTGGGWLADMATRLARKLGVPLIHYFLDWGFYGLIAHRPVQAILSRNYVRNYKKADLAFCISEGMREALGPHENAHILHPIPHRSPPPPQLPYIIKNHPPVVTFAGSLGDWYGIFLERLIGIAGPEIEFRVFGRGATWSASFDEKAKKEGIYRGFIAVDDLHRELDSSDILLLIMGFDRGAEQVEKTSFKSKWVDYLLLNKPVLVWGPEYSTAVRAAKSWNSAAVCTSPKPEDCLKALEALIKSPDTMTNIVQNGYQMFQKELNPDQLYQDLKAPIQRLLG